MIPIRDLNPTRTTPFVTIAIIIAAAWVYLAIQPKAPQQEARFLVSEAAIPCEITTGRPITNGALASGQCGAPGRPLDPAKNIWLSVFASMFLHANIIHLAGNLWILWIFGNNVEDALGHMTYLAVYLAGGLVAMAGQVALIPDAVAPVIGASGAIAAVMGVYLILFPGARVLTVVLPLFFLPFPLPAVVFLVLWFVLQFGYVGAASGVAWGAHVAGFLFGSVIGLLVRRCRRAYRFSPFR